MNTPASHAKNEADRFAGCLLGLAVGDAVGTTVEFRPRGTFKPMTDMVGGGPFRLPAGAWTDDTSMALCLGESLLKCDGFDAADQMRRYVRWWKDGYWSSNGICFDIGETVREALVAFRETGNPFSGPTRDRSAGNGSIMRLAPVAMAYYPDYGAVIERCGVSSWTTHGTTACVEACRLFGNVLYKALSGLGKKEILTPGFDDRDARYSEPGIAAIARGEYFEKGEDEILGLGYVVASLEAALWCFWTTESYEEAVLKAANLGDDADTTAAICGQVAGAFYGESGIPVGWLGKLVRGAEIGRMGEELRMLVPDGVLGEEARDLVKLLPAVRGLTAADTVAEWVRPEPQFDEKLGCMVHTIGHPIHADIIEDLRAEMSRDFWQDGNYVAPEMQVFWEEPALLAEASLGEIRRVICGMVRQERFCWGDVWSGYLESGVLVGVLGRVEGLLGGG